MSQGDQSSPKDGKTAEAPADVRNVGRAYHQKRNVKIIMDSTADFATGVAERLGVEVIPFSYVDADGVEHQDDRWQEQDPHEFYEHMRKNPDARFHTAAVTPGRYFEVFECAAQEGLPTIYMGLPAGLSSSIDSARQAAQMIRERYPDFELYVLDRRCDSAAGQLLAIEVVRQASLGLTAEELYEWARDARYFIHGYFTLDSFDTLAAGGRIPPAAANVGGKLDIKPELSYDLNGALSLRGMCRGRKKALRAIVQDFRENYAHDTSLPVGIVSTDAQKDADWLEAQIRKEKGCEDLTIIHSTVSPILGAHVGPGMVALVFWGKDRREKISLTDRIARKVKKGARGPEEG
ncbi:DegV family protein [Olsenella sp. DNF00959]|uniref:DegV family protein n=1 Tax=Olsenella sp. DNF00959 TaxID=1476999 RepID=UPI0007825543|nr:DegV family protein [Olsenella sp. DNF00959]KXB61682.1 EDD domain protein, DegV family [Olsenella sp. DNF00959]